MAVTLGRVLVVDDDRSRVDLLCGRLDEHGYESVGFTSGEAGVEHIREKPDFDVLLVGRRLSGMDGLAFLRSALEIDPSLVGIVVAGDETVETSVQAIRAGAFECLTWPFATCRLLPLLWRAMQVRRLKTENARLRETVAVCQKSEQALRESTHRLRAELAELQQAHQKVIQHERLRALGTLARRIAHEINNALTPVLGFSELLLDRPAILRDPNKVTEYTQRINLAAREAASVVTGLRDFYRHADPNEALETLDLVEMAAQAASLSPGTGTVPLPEATDSDTASSQLRVLLVDDETLIRETIMEYLAADGHSVETASNGHEGLEKFRSGEFDLVITDRTMPEMSGDCLAATIKQIMPEEPVILLTGIGEFMHASAEHPFGVDMIVSKPPTLNSLREAVATVIAKTRSN